MSLKFYSPGGFQLLFLTGAANSICPGKAFFLRVNIVPHFELLKSQVSVPLSQGLDFRLDPRIVQ